MQRPIYLDYMSTTPVDPQVIEQMQCCLGSESAFGNASSQHRYGWDAEELINQAREQLAKVLHADMRELIWTGGATESNNLAILGTARFYQRQGKHLITQQTEHSAVLDVFRQLESEGFEVSYLPTEPSGWLDPQRVADAIRPDTLLVSVMHVNNELGVIQPVEQIAEITRARGVRLHVDAAQSLGKVRLDLRAIPIDLLSLSAHKVYGPKGMGALFVRRQPRTRLTPILFGGGQEQGLRPGTLATHQIVGMGAAVQLAETLFDSENARIHALCERLWQGISVLPGLRINGKGAPRVAQCLNVSFAGVDGEALELSLRDLALSRGSACNSATREPSHVLLALGLTREQADQSLRFSLGRYTTEEEIDRTIAQVIEQVTRLRRIAGYE